MLQFVLCVVLLAVSSRYRANGSPGADECRLFGSGVFKDRNDGDNKAVRIEGNTITITPPKSNSSASQSPLPQWTIQSSHFNVTSCSGLLNFSVKGGPPSLLATLAVHGTDYSIESIWEFTDPSGGLAPAGTVLNRWDRTKEFDLKSPGLSRPSSHWLSTACLVVAVTCCFAGIVQACVLHQQFMLEEYERVDTNSEEAEHLAV